MAGARTHAEGGGIACNSCTAPPRISAAMAAAAQGELAALKAAVAAGDVAKASSLLATLKARDATQRCAHSTAACRAWR